MVIARLARAILGDERSVLPVSVPAEGAYGIEPADVCLSLPCVIGRGGVEGRILPGLSEAEEKDLRTSGRVLMESRIQLEATD